LFGKSGLRLAKSSATSKKQNKKNKTKQNNNNNNNKKQSFQKLRLTLVNAAMQHILSLAKDNCLRPYFGQHYRY